MMILGGKLSTWKEVAAAALMALLILQHHTLLLSH